MKMRIEPGCLLAAWPDLRDPNFEHSVIAMVEHADHGAFGLIVNRPLDAHVDQLLPEHPILGRMRTRVFLGGPVDHTRMQFLHRHGERIPGGHLVLPGLWLGGDLEALAELLLEQQEATPEQQPEGVRLFVGYAGWGAGQLEGELETGSWVPAPYMERAIFGPHGETAWRSVVQSVEGGAELGNTPPDLRWN